MKSSVYIADTGFKMFRIKQHLGIWGGGEELCVGRNRKIDCAEHPATLTLIDSKTAAFKTT